MCTAGVYEIFYKITIKLETRKKNRMKRDRGKLASEARNPAYEVDAAKRTEHYFQEESRGIRGKLSLPLGELFDSVDRNSASNDCYRWEKRSMHE